MNRAQGYTRLLTSPGLQINGATVTVKLKGTATLATLFSDDLAVPTPKANPFVTDQYGYWFFYARDNRFDISFAGGVPAVLAYALGDVPIFSGSFLALNAADYGVVGDNITDDTVALQAALNAGGGIVPIRLRIPAGFVCKITQGLICPSLVTIDGYGATLDATAMGLAGRIETLTTLGSNIGGSQTHDVTILGLTLQNNPRSAQLYSTGYGLTFKPYNLTYRDVTTICPVGGAALNGIEFTEAAHIVIDRHYNTRGVSAIAFGSDSYATMPSDDITVMNSRTEHTTGFGYQFAGAQHIKVIGCYIDGTDIVIPGTPVWDYTGITIDRCQNVTLTGNIIISPGEAGIFVTGSYHVVVSSNQINGGGLTLVGIYIAYNAELLPATLAIHESLYVSVVANEVTNMKAGSNGILFNGVRYSSMTGNVVGAPMGAGSEDIVVQDGVRGATPMLSKFNTLAGNICAGSGTMHIAAAATLDEAMNCIGNIATTLLGSAHARVFNGVGGGVDFTNGVTLYRDTGTGFLTIGGGAVFGDLGVAGTFAHTGANVGFYNHATVNQQTLTIGVAVLADVITALQNLGLVHN